MYYRDHFPSHFHAQYNDYEALMSIESGEIINGELPKKQLRLVQAWIELHRDELLENFEILRKGSPNFKKIDPL